MNDEKYIIYESKFGNIEIRYNGNKVIYMKKIMSGKNHNEEQCPNELTSQVIKELEEYFEGTREKFDFKYELHGTDFQLKVWHALEKIPYGETRSYKDIAIAIGNPKASRAIGMANNRNPITIAVPCHRVIGASGKLVGYAGGVEMKEELLKMESRRNLDI